MKSGATPDDDVVDVPDLYGTLLNIPPGPRPPHYYDLLGIELFCGVPERIRQSTRKQFRRVKPSEDHPHQATRHAVQHLLNRIALAQAELLDSARKDAYDTELAGKLGIDRAKYLAERSAAPLPEHALKITAGPERVGTLCELVTSESPTIGSDARCDITLPPHRAAAVHCRLEHAGGTWSIFRHDARCALRINEEPCAKGMLTDGDVIDVGGFRLRFVDLPDGHRLQSTNTPLTLMVHKGPCIPMPAFHALHPEAFFVGSGAEALWQLPDPRLPKRLLRIQPFGNAWEITTVDPAGRWLVNGQETSSRYIEHRDVITAGDFEIIARLRR